MDERKRNIRLVKTGGRRVTKSTTEYERSGLKKETPNGRYQSKAREVRPAESKLERRVRYQKRQKQKRLKMQRMRALVILILIIIILIVLFFMTPIFNIRSVSVDGNRLVAAEQFEELLKPMIGENLFRTGASEIRKTLKTIPYIDHVEVQKKAFPPSLKVHVTEYKPAGMIKAGEKNLLLSSGLHILSDDGEMIEPVPVITGISVSGEVGELLGSEDTEMLDAVMIALSTLEKTGLIDKIIEINVRDKADIIINYDDRITVHCGTQLDLERKLRLFKETISNEYFTENIHGTIEFADSGKAVFTP